MEQKTWHCPVCGQDFTGPEPPSPCPVCGAPASVFTCVEALRPRQWLCLVCGQVFEGNQPPVPCPVCGAGEQAFVPEGATEAGFRRDTDEQFVLIGGGAAALECAKAIRSRNHTARIIMVCGEPVPPYNRPALSDVLADGLSLRSILLQEEGWYREQAIELLVGVEATAIDRQARRVELSNGDALIYDKLLLATGSRAFVPVKTGGESMPLFVLRSYEDCSRVAEAAKQATRAVVVGGGILGIEAAVALRERGVQVTVVEFAPRILAAQADEAAGSLVQRRLESRGIQLRCGVSVQQVSRREVLLTDGSSVDSDFVLVAAGVRSETSLAAACGLDVGRGILVDESLCTSDQAIYAAGDCAEYQGKTGGLWSTATAQGQAAGAHMAGDTDAPYSPLPPATVFEGAGASLFSCGAVNGARLQSMTYEDGFSGIYKRVLLEDGHTVGVVFYGDTAGAGDAIGLISRRAPAREAAPLLVK